MTTRSLLAARIPLLALVIGVINPACADIYSYTDEAGATHFSNIPNDRRYTLFMREPDQQHSLPPIPMQTAGAAVNRENRARFQPFIQTAASTYAIDPALLHAVILAESGYNPAARSRQGAVGLMQLMPETARRYGVQDPYDPQQNINGGARCLSDLKKLFNQDLNLALAAYNAGENAVIRHHNRIPPFRETQLYVPKVMKIYRSRQ